MSFIRSARHEALAVGKVDRPPVPRGVAGLPQHVAEGVGSPRRHRDVVLQHLRVHAAAEEESSKYFDHG